MTHSYRQATERNRRQGALYGSQPSLSHSASTGSATTLAGYSSASHDRNGSSPPTVYVPTMQSSSATVDVLARVETKDEPQPGQIVIQAAAAVAPTHQDSVPPRTSLHAARNFARTEGARSVATADETESGDEPVTGIAGFLDRVAP